MLLKQENEIVIPLPCRQERERGNHSSNLCKRIFLCYILIFLSTKFQICVTFVWNFEITHNSYLVPQCMPDVLLEHLCKLRHDVDVYVSVVHCYVMQPCGFLEPIAQDFCCECSGRHVGMCLILV